MKDTRNIQTITAIAVWLASTVINNLMKKKVVGVNQLNWPMPLFISTAHLNVEAILSICVLYAMPKFRPNEGQTFDQEQWKRWIIPSCVSGALDIALNNYSLRFLDLTQVVQIRSISPIMVVLAGVLFGKPKPRKELMGVLVLVVFGVGLMMHGEPSASSMISTEWAIVAKLLCLLGTVFGAIRWNLVEEMLKHTGDNQIYVDFIMACVMGVIMCALSLVFEGWPQFGNGMNVSVILSLSYISGILAFLFVISSFVVMSHTSVLTFSITGVCVELAIMYWSHRAFGDTVSMWSFIGFGLVVVSIILFNVIQ
jgi:solute carrier family 35 protein C2